MKSRSCKTKGMLGQKEIAELIHEILGISLDDLLCTTAGVKGTDIKAAESVKEHMPFSIESKRTEKISIHACIQQAIDNAVIDGRPYLLCHRRSREPWNATLDFKVLLGLLKQIKNYKVLIGELK